MRTNAWKLLLGSLAIGAMAASGSGCATSVSNDGGGGGAGGDEPTSTTTTSTTTTSTTSTTTTTTTTTSSSSGGGEGGAGGSGGSGGSGGAGGGGALEGDSCADAVEIVDGLTLTGTDFTQYANDYAFTDPTCASFNFAYQRPDVVFVRDLQAGDTVQITEHGTLDVIMHAVSGTCGAAACDGTISDQTAAQQQSTGLIYTATQAETVYFFVESLYGLPSESVVDITTQTFDIRFDLVSCGDGTVSAATEGCDDGNNTDMDGCSATCTVEAGYLCTGAPSVCTEFPSCASPIVVTDDFTFAGTNMTQFPNSHTFGGTGCSGGTTARPDLTFEVQLAAGDSVVVTEQAALDALIHLQTGTCGATTTCTSSTDSDTTGVTYTATTAQSVYVFLEPYGATSTSAYDLRFNYIRCGDGVRESTEGCDDGAKLPGDGCSATCTVEPGFICDQANPSVCGPVPAADCSAPIMATDGFSYVGTNIGNFGHTYFYSGAGCVNPTGTLQRPEIVFEVDLVAGERLTVTEHGTLDAMLHLQTGACGGATCQGSTDTDLTGVSYTASGTETVYVVMESVQPSPSAASTFDVRFDITQCGDGVREGTEVCDDGNMVFDDGCSSSCQVEAGWYCFGSPSMCEILPAADCSDPVIAGNGLQFAGADIYQFTNNITFGGTGCSGGSTTARPEIVFEVDLLAGSTLKVTELANVDALIHLQTGTCGGSNSCVASTDSDTTGITYQSLSDQTVYVYLEPYSASSTSTAYDLRFEIFQCGDGAVGGSETCDDGNMMAGDGCSPTCSVESGFICAGSPSTCGPEANWAQLALAGCTGTIVQGSGMSLPMSIPDSAPDGGAMVSIPIVATGNVQGMAMRFGATHDWPSDMDVWLRSPAGMPAVPGLDVCSDNGGINPSTFSTIFSDAAAVNVSTVTSGPITGFYKPEQAFSTFNGSPANGTWSLRVSDDATGDTGTVTLVELAICVVP